MMMMPRLATLPLVLLGLLASYGAGVDAATSQADINAYLAAHNTVRAQHGAKNLAWDESLASAAQTWVNKCKFQHSGGSLGPYGENLAAGTGGAYNIAAAVKSWTNEVSQYNAQSPVPSHFTQVVWKGSQKVGCAVQECSGIFPPQYGNAKFYACEYFPAGNVIGQFPYVAFLHLANVQA
ncbi:transporter [Ganoderma sinense ZZ0214-1]|uniref:Transporter n=1 Tax=Ganoderma sinense ZZ0214-1 TaxID=1077348 RepID=A0A2G8S342_9APHY|nr:transporter [Ganoderma sinense ZZ0214-1]